MSSFASPAHLLALTSRRRNSSVVSGTRYPICNLKYVAVNSSSENPKPSRSPPFSLNSLISSKSLALSAASCVLFHNPILSGRESIFNFGGGGGGAGGGGGGGGGSHWSHIFFLAAIAKDDYTENGWDSHGLPVGNTYNINALSGFKKYKVSEIFFSDGTKNPFFDMVSPLVSLQAGAVYTKAQLRKEKEALALAGMFEKVDFLVKTAPDGTINIIISSIQKKWQSADSFRCINVGFLPQYEPVEKDPDLTRKERIAYYRTHRAHYYKKRIKKARPCLLPTHVRKEITQMLKKQGHVNPRLLQKIRDRVEQWYHENGYACAEVVNFGKLNTKNVVCEVVEGNITGLDIQFQDKLGNVCQGTTQLRVLERELPEKLRNGQVFNCSDAEEALKSLNSLGLFSTIEVNPRPDKSGGIVVEIKLKELEPISTKLSLEWTFVQGYGGLPALASIQPGGTVSFEHRNINGLNRSFLGSVTTSNFLSRQDDLAFKLEYVQPNINLWTRDFKFLGYKPRNTTFHACCFNGRKLSPVFTGGPGVEVPPIWIERIGSKVNLIENFTRQTKLTYGFVMEEITTRNEVGQIAQHGRRVIPGAGFVANGPPTTLSGTGVDRSAFLQANITHDNTKFVNGAIAGGRYVFQLDQGLGIGSRNPCFNRHQLTVTQFLQLKQVKEGAAKPKPPVLVLHCHYGGCVGDLPNYAAFTLGGPYSVRGYNVGELGAARYILELAAELRIPVRNTHAYVFCEHGNDLGSSRAVTGSPTAAYRRSGNGSSTGLGVKLGPVRAEFAIRSSGIWAILFHSGERF